MIDEATIYKDARRRLLDILHEQCKNVFKMFYLGAPSFLPDNDSLPCMIIHKVKSKPTIEATGLDNTTETIVISLIFNEKDDFNDPASWYQNTTMNKITNLVEARDATTLEWHSGTIMGAIRTNFTLDDATLGNEPDINYNINPLPQAPTLMEATITLTIKSIIPVPSRT